MQKIPQIVTERLKAGAAVSGHPDADLLTAFGERSLPEPERTGVLAHLALCADCREIVALALPVTESVATASVAVRRPWFIWPAFRWGFATAGVALITIGIVEFQRHQPANSAALVGKQAKAESVATNLQIPAAPPTSAPVPASKSQPGASAKATTLAKKMNPIVAEGAMRVRQIPPLSPPAISARAPAPASDLIAKQKSEKAPGLIAGASQLVAVEAQKQAVSTKTSDNDIASEFQSPAEPFFGDNAGPLTRAKPADTAPSEPAANRLLASPRWSISAVGGLQRSLDKGKTWQNVYPDVSALPIVSGASTVMGGPMTPAAQPDSMRGQGSLKTSANPIFFRAVVAAGNEVWAGGSNAALFHSSDGGNRWTRVLPSFSGTALTGDVLSVEFPDPQHGTVTTSTPEIWTTSDGGQTWHKQ